MGCKVSSFLMRFLENIVFYKCCFWIKHILENYIWIYVFLKVLCYDPIIIIIYEKCIIFGIAFGEMYEFLT